MDRVDLQVRPKEIFGLIGPNGAGIDFHLEVSRFSEYLSFEVAASQMERGRVPIFLSAQQTRQEILR